MIDEESRLLVNGRLTRAAGGRTFDNLNPATEEIIGRVADADAGDLDAAVAAARDAFDLTEWSVDHQLRGRCLLQLQDALEREREEIRAELVAEAGCPVSMTYMTQLDLPLADALRWPAAAIGDIPWVRDLPVVELFGLRSWRKVVKEPVGVVGVITPWSNPIGITLSKLGQALATGNTVVLAPAPETPWTAARLGRLIAEETEIPPGVVNVITASDRAIGEALVTDPRVDLIAFTGSTATGRRIMEQGASTLKRLCLELSGKSADIILDDADFAAKLCLAWMVCLHGGQGSAMPSRLLVPRTRYDEAIELVADGFSKVPIGDPTDPANIQGPLISAGQRDRVLRCIAGGVREGARLVVGGGRPTHLEKGYYVEPTLFADVDNVMTIAREEILGPVLVVIPFEDDADAVRIANDSGYGLSGAVTSGSGKRAESVAARLRAGRVSVNGGIWYGADLPFGGYKASGLGVQNGIEGFEQYLETKALSGLVGR
ncbi:aldehyde dehydrogenase family protein [Pseudofrankia inefficax]|uniref:Aldehyde Dehydrogenase n=1 Tax=Pseudofrankia inefficax (strain DSM 45817 / CECT 9037 / DDB 130130 / EuI1c) TaxID=298654 RepID=E3IVF4_PSEI1|nr:aldehyde dehydrogenase family protein [Pseudofrankia inefficax]ADP81318.1 Aldehyde Dehydrogenase [Pseudofrankia inefficax]